MLYDALTGKKYGETIHRRQYGDRGRFGNPHGHDGGAFRNQCWNERLFESKERSKSAKEDDTNAKMAETNAQIDDREMAEHMAKKRADAISGDENPATGNVKDGRLQTEKTVGQGGDFVRTGIHTDDAVADSEFPGSTTSMARSGEMPSVGSSLEEDRGNINAAGAWDMISSIAGADMEKNADDMEIKKENEIDGEKEYASAVEECINSRNARTRELMDSMEDNPAKLAQELGELESREQEAVRGREMLAAEHEEKWKTAGRSRKYRRRA